MVWKIKEMSLMEMYRMCRGRKAKRNWLWRRRHSFVSLLGALLSARAHRDVAAAFRLHQKSDDKADSESDMDLICIAILPPYSHCIPNVTAVVYYDHKLISFNVGNSLSVILHVTTRNVCVHTNTTWGKGKHVNPLPTGKTFSFGTS